LSTVKQVVSVRIKREALGLAKAHFSSGVPNELHTDCEVASAAIGLPQAPVTYKAITPAASMGAGCV